MRRFAFVLAASFLCVGVSGQSIVYPAAGQTPEQQQKDQAECNTWAQQTTGIDPLVIAQNASQPQAAAPTGGRARGALGGAAAGAAIGAIAGDTGEGAAIGAVVGTLGGGMRQRRQQQSQQSQQQANQQQNQAALDTYTRAVNACMQGRHYTIQ